MNWPAAVIAAVSVGWIVVIWWLTRNLLREAVSLSRFVKPAVLLPIIVLSVLFGYVFVGTIRRLF